MNQYDDAERSYLKALDVWRQISQGADSVDIANTLRRLGWCYRDAGMDRKAKEKLTQALDITLKVDPENADIGRIKSYLSTHSTDETPQTSHHVTRESSSQSNIPINKTLSKRKRCCICSSNTECNSCYLCIRVNQSPLSQFNLHLSLIGCLCARAQNCLLLDLLCLFAFFKTTMQVK